MPESTFPTSKKVIRIGWVGTGPFSFYGDYMRVINAPEPNPLLMRVTHVWGDDYSKNYAGSPDYVKKMLDRWNGDRQSPGGLAKRYSIPNVCGDFHDMVDKVDAAMINIAILTKLATPMAMVTSTISKWNRRRILTGFLTLIRP